MTEDGGAGRRSPTLPLSRALRLLVRLVLATSGLVLFAVGIVLNVQAGIGLQPWWALHFGMSQYLPMTIGETSMIVGVLVLALAWWLGVKPGPATVMNVFIVGLATDHLLAAGLVPKASGGLDSYLLLLAGVWVIGFGTAVYVKGDLGAGPRDSLMLALAYHLRGRVGLARNAMDVVVTLIGWLMGAPIGIGTVVFALGTGPVVAFWFRALRVTVRRRARPVPSSATISPREAPRNLPTR